MFLGIKKKSVGVQAICGLINHWLLFVVFKKIISTVHFLPLFLVGAPRVASMTTLKKKVWMKSSVIQDTGNILNISGILNVNNLPKKCIDKYTLE